MFDPRPHHRDDPVDVLFDGVQRSAFRRLAHHAPELARGGERRLPRGADIALVGPHGYETYARALRIIRLSRTTRATSSANFAEGPTYLPQLAAVVIKLIY